MKRIIFLLAALAPLASQADDNMTFHGTLVAPPCTISQGKAIEVDFGDDLGVNKIDGSNYKQPVNYTVDCETGYSVNNLAVVVDTTHPAAFDSAAVGTDKTGLGIRILVDGAVATFAKRVAVNDPASPPVIEAVPVQDPAVTLTEGAFEATLTLRADYM
ncbi:fimbrial protein [Cronobacter dublinensis]|uniref:fimbrial protein n=1 Tax=Cronobacter dublinensis TaxID=413497 RepID=UPI000CFDBEBD|nr:fimbrial protein [Cronobacter dublinensis]ELY6210997.1 fimbrial protein [Cronobacter dublinensis]EMD9246445.1 fimbrial protein [Cronobacter dublinensis]MDI6443513.1 fimbrial protein [Cronobacter dublinensis]MDK1192750.1 fimbrial protein [Cronobacter dublinensis]MDK1201209.1 fimbrial protein [Cronobacter dublinensis]